MKRYKKYENNIEVECLPGATAFVPALVNSGLPNDRFVFESFFNPYVANLTFCLIPIKTIEFFCL